MKTLTQLETALAKVRKDRLKGKYEEGMFGIKECKESIKFQLYIHKLQGLTIQKVYGELVERALTEIGFNELMVIACEELMEEGAE